MPGSNELSCAVVIVCHNYGRFLAQAIESVLAQTLPATEIVVALDHCSDNSHEVAMRYPVEAIETHACDPHLARRLGVRSTRSEVLIFLDADDWLSPNYIKEGLAGFDDERVGIVTGSIQRFGNDTSRATAAAGDIQRENCVTSAALVRRGAIEQSRCFENFSLIHIESEDWETWKRIDRADWKIHPEPGITHHHRRHDENRTLSNLYHQNRWSRMQRRLAGNTDRPLRIGYVSPSAGTGGVETQAAALVKYARRLQWVGCHVPEGAKRDPTILAAMPPIYDGEAGLARLCDEVDAIYAWGPARLIRQVVERTGKPIIYGVHGEGTWTRNNLREVVDLVDVLLCVSHGAVRAIPPWGRRKARLVRGGADLQTVICDRDREEIRRAWDVAAGELAVGYVGRLSWEKNPVVVAQAAALIPGATLVVCSPQSDDVDHPLRRDIADILSDRVVWTSSAKQPMGEVYRGIDCLVVASHEEGMPTVTLEAWAAGVPVVSTPVGLIQELEPRHGPLVERLPRKPTAWAVAAAITQAVKPNPLRTEAARELVINQLSMQRMAVEFEEAARKIGPRRQRPFVIRTLPRSGTHMLMTALDSHPELTCHGLVFSAKGTQQRFAGMSAEEIYTRHTGPGEGFVVHGTFPGDPGPYPCTNDLWPLIDRERPVLVVLGRRDLLRRCVSFQKAIETDVWKVFSPRDGSGSCEAVRINPRRLRLWIDRAIQSHEFAKRSFPWAIFLDYEDLVADWETHITRIQRAIGVKAVLPLKPTTHKQSDADRPIGELIANYDELREEFRGTDYERWFVLAEEAAKPKRTTTRRGVGGIGGKARGSMIPVSPNITSKLAIHS